MEGEGGEEGEDAVHQSRGPAAERGGAVGEEEGARRWTITMISAITTPLLHSDHGRERGVEGEQGVAGGTEHGQQPGEGMGGKLTMNTTTLNMTDPEEAAMGEEGGGKGHRLEGEERNTMSLNMTTDRLRDRNRSRDREREEVRWGPLGEGEGDSEGDRGDDDGVRVRGRRRWTVCALGVLLSNHGGCPLHCVYAVIS